MDKSHTFMSSHYRKIYSFLEKTYGLSEDQCRDIMALNDDRVLPEDVISRRIGMVVDKICGYHELVDEISLYYIGSPLAPKYTAIIDQRYGYDNPTKVTGSDKYDIDKYFFCRGKVVDLG